jgi:hypothetical protein
MISSEPPTKYATEAHMGNKLQRQYQKYEDFVDDNLRRLAAKSYTGFVILVILAFVGWALWH